VIAVAGVVAYFGTMDWGDNLVAFVVLGAFIAVPIGLIGLAITSDSTGERIVSGIVAAVVVLVDVAFMLFVLAMTQV
jgi:formate hydrogenlyase subunit 4